MKITVLQDHLRSGGTERQSILLCREFGVLGHAALLVTFRPGGRLAGPGPARPLSLQSFDTGVDWFAPGLLRTVLGTAPDIVLCMGKTANCFAGRIQRRASGGGLGTRVVATLRAGGRLPWFYYSSVRRAAHVVANSREAAAELVSRHGFDPGRVSAIHNALAFPASPGARDEQLRAGLGAGPGSTVLLSVGMFRPEKNQRALVEIAAGLRADWDWRLWFLGDGPELARCARLAARTGAAGRIRFLGFQPDPVAYYRAADIAVHASREEALSNALIEAQSNGLPAVACQALGIRECMVAGRTGFVVAQGDHEGFRAALARLASDTPAERAERAGEARAFARGAFDPATQVGAHIGLFESLLRDTEPAPRP
ncbi:MAG TPA: glycosyltransferase [Opitutaceae bacterium]|nr:glycosyltransferase [Opitutaceae bacterium]